MNGWIGVDLDGTLARYDGWHGVDHIGEPIPDMVQRVQDWLSQGQDVRILTARVSHNNTSDSLLSSQFSMVHIMNWCAEHIGQVLPITCMKDYQMIELWDDRAVRVEHNTGIPCPLTTY